MVKIHKGSTRTDFEIIEKLADTIWRNHYIPLVGKAQIDYMLAKYQSAEAIENQVADGFEYYVLNYSKIPVGYIAIKQETNSLFLSKIYVLKTFRGKKIGKSAMDFIEEKAKAYHLNAIRLTVNIHNADAIAAYEKLGFVNIGPLVTDIGNGFVMDDYEMQKKFK
ncbi:GNAT family N-acetyltransferase [Changchengzhania lutea]|uniref:GNAT family N-acetyltransferase n=1 Tax=Changchengzhania lutea TaxID=2049305 RepID=UPI00115D5565|nr:GNAT family N-acetyltransferase [Changchengzhania lutea]